MTGSLFYCGLPLLSMSEIMPKLVFMGAVLIGMWLLSAMFSTSHGEKYANYTGRITVRIQTREMVDPTSYFDSNKNRNVKQEKCYVTYEFYVNGRRYEGSSESSDSELDKNEQVICYDPEDPSKNCTLWYLEKQTTGFWG
ncbi:MAG: hypothetical protein IK081_02790 [Lachnospiraceae bacterium]|nr:hypothetical protein [Lachnospiraceae bacterium]